MTVRTLGSRHVTTFKDGVKTTSFIPTGMTGEVYRVGVHPDGSRVVWVEWRRVFRSSPTGDESVEGRDLEDESLNVVLSSDVAFHQDDQL